MRRYSLREPKFYPGMTESVIVLGREYGGRLDKLPRGAFRESSGSLCSSYLSHEYEVQNVVSSGSQLCRYERSKDHGIHSSLEMGILAKITAGEERQDVPHFSRHLNMFILSAWVPRTRTLLLIARIAIAELLGSGWVMIHGGLEATTTRIVRDLTLAMAISRLRRLTIWALHMVAFPATCRVGA